MDKAERRRTIIHFDMDAFYPSVEVLDNPQLKGKPVVVGGTSRRGVVSSASYEARKFGVHSAQPIATAMRLCPSGIFLPVRMSRYKDVSREIFKLFHSFTPLVEPLSIDEAFLDVTGSGRLFGQPKAMAAQIKHLVHKKIGLTVSAGVAPSKFTAKIASDLEKPDGLTVVPHDRVREFLDPLPIERMWGVGKATRKVLKRLNIHTFADLRQTQVEVLEKRLGKHGLQMHLLSMGIDERGVVPEHEAKSIGHEQTFLEDVIRLEAAKRELLELANRVARRMRKHAVSGQTITLKVKYSDFTQITRSQTLSESTDDGTKIYQTVCRLLEKTSVGKRPARLLGVSVSQLSFPEMAEQLYLFNADRENQKKRMLNAALDSLQEKFGEKSIRPGTLIKE